MGYKDTKLVVLLVIILVVVVGQGMNSKIELLLHKDVRTFPVVLLTGKCACCEGEAFEVK